jgi:hypothetical protein
MKNILFQLSALAFTFLLLTLSCGSSLRGDTRNSDEKREVSAEWKAFWNQGLAEVSEYELDQARYGENHPGNAILVFVTEPFNTELQVKSDDVLSEANSITEVLKLNAIRHFKTGVYDYSVMESVFTPVNAGKVGQSLKASCSVQDWCGQVFSQYNLKNGAYRARQFSYFEKEADSDIIIKASVLEDEIWTLLRIDPSLLPVGNIKLIPSMHFLRFSHIAPNPYDAVGSITHNDSLSTYHLKYDEPSRELKIHFKSQFPYTIESWEEIYLSGFGNQARMLTTKAKLKKRTMMDYWNLNGVNDTW